MEIFMNGKMQEVTKAKPHEIAEVLEDGVNVFIYGPSGYGKTSIVIEYAEKVHKKLKIVNIAQKLAEAIGGIPYATAEGFYKELLSEELKDVIECDGEDWIIFFDEMNQGSQEVLNTLYGICHPNGKMRYWAGHSISKAQIVAAGNLDDGTDGTVYLNPIPTPLHERFFVFEMIPDAKDTTKYLKEKWKNIPGVLRYIEAMLDAKINPRNIDTCLDIIAYKKSGLLLQAKLGEAVTAKIKEIEKSIDKNEKIKSMDPAAKLKGAKKLYEQYKENGQVVWGVVTITEEEDLLAMLKTEAGLNDEEVASVVKSYKKEG